LIYHSSQRLMSREDIALRKISGIFFIKELYMNFISVIKKKWIPNSFKQRFRNKPATQEEIFLNGYNAFLKTGQTPLEAYYAFINLYCSTNGKFHENFNAKIKAFNPPKKESSTLEGVPGTFSVIDFTSINSKLNENGYFHFNKKLSKELCNKLVDFALKTPATMPPAYDKKILYDPQNPLAEIYRFSIQDLANNFEIQNLMMDPVLVNIARNYLGCEPIFDFPAMWWSTAFQKEASSEAAQLYHFDLDRVKWLKIFFYLNDVTEENGPHCYIRGTHKPGAKSDELLKRGYVRIKDGEIHPDYPATDIKVVCGEAGSIFAGDTKCWHKGMHLKSGHRLVLEFEYTSSMFAANNPKLEVTNCSKEFKAYCLANKVFASNIIFK
jgi:hypothetical protein